MPSNAAIRNPIYPNIDHVILTLEDFDFEAAHREGWTICNLGTYGDGTPRVVLQRLNRSYAGSPAFKEDRDVWAHVVARALEPSVLHLQALTLVDRRERMAVFAHCRSGILT
jgi:hypothetical protein